jgi:hypothetical protein
VRAAALCAHGLALTRARPLPRPSFTGYTVAMDCANKARNMKRCTCTYAGCERHGVCCECVAYHRSAEELPACFFTREEERSYDRSVSAFVSARTRRA